MYCPKKCYKNCFPYRIDCYNPCYYVCDFFKYIIVNEHMDSGYHPLEEIVVHKLPKYLKDNSTQTDEIHDISIENWEDVEIL